MWVRIQWVCVCGGGGGDVFGPGSPWVAGACCLSEWVALSSPNIYLTLCLTGPGQWSRHKESQLARTHTHTSTNTHTCTHIHTINGLTAFLKDIFKKLKKLLYLTKRKTQRYYTLLFFVHLLVWINTSTL